MKEYKIDLSGFDGKVREVVSEAVQRHAFELGCRWFGVFEKRALHKGAPYLFTHKDGSLGMQMSGTVSWFNSHTNTLISPADFLALTPEDVKDEVIVTTEPAGWLLVTGGESLTLVPNGTRVVKINGSGVLSVEPFTRTVAERFLPKEGK